MKEINVSAPSGTYFDFTDDRGASRAAIFNADNITFIGGTLGTFDQMLSVVMSTSAAFGMTDGVSLLGTEGFLISFNEWFFQTASATAVAIDLGTAVLPNIEFGNLIILGVSGTVGLSGLASSGNVTTGSIATLADSSFLGGVTPLQNIAKEDLQWRVSSSPPLSDSRSIGSLHVNNNAAATSITVQNQWEDLNLNASAVASSNIERWSLDNTTTGELELLDPEGFDGSYVATITFIGQPGQDDYEFRAVVNGSPTADGIVMGTSTNNNNRAVPLVVPLNNLVATDKVRIQARNTTGIDDLTVISLAVEAQ
jgi:hypothetical protein